MTSPTGPNPTPPAPRETFRELFAAEMSDLGLPSPETSAFSEPGEDREAWVIDNPNDVAGLALSGGGIRSAIFNLGLLQGLAELDLLGQFHYLATVSGGGYVGGWWSAFRQRRIAAAAAAAAAPSGAPEAPGSFPKPRADGQEAPEVHHLREFSRFLAPRWGFFELETWQFFAALFTAAGPSLLVTVSLLFVLESTWLLALLLFFTSDPPGPDVLLGILLLVVLVVFEIGTARKEHVRNGVSPNPLGYLAVLLLVGGIVFGVPALLPVGAGAIPVDVFVERIALERTDADQILFYPAGVFVTLGAVLVLLRFVFSRAFQPAQGWLRFLRAPLDRVIARLLALTVAWVGAILVFGLVWYMRNSRVLAVSSTLLGLGSGGAFAWLQKLTARESNRAKRGGWLESMRLLTPRVLAFVASAAALVGVAWLVLRAIESDFLTEALAAAAAIVGASLFVLAPNEVGLHAFYRGRIARAFLGASNPLREELRAGPGGAPRLVVSPNQEASEQPGDDLLVTDLPRAGPLHLVCCAANDLAGNPLTTLNRGARSAVVSRLGFSVADSFYRWSAPGQKPVSLGTALTASGAAFNSNMGAKSVDYGPGAAFVMTALNLRLGLWLVPPKKGLLERVLPGALFFEEMFARTVADWRKGAVHLSDGGHFDNTALYELLRRHCRYVVASDCGEDPEVLFDDLGNAFRRAREDFGVEIDVDLDVLRPDARGFCAQHAAVGEIRYPNGDRGILVVVKPGLVGEEPNDVLQYKSRNPRFPHESTGDQFYDEKQWESYRRLGAHAARTIFRFVQHVVDPRALSRDALFGQARREWTPTPPELEAARLARSTEANEVERALAALDSPEVLRQVYPELALAPRALTPQEVARVLPVLVRMGRLMEDVYVTCDLERAWNHPLNLGWTNSFARWATMPVFRGWWPLLNPMFGPKFVRFMDETFALPSLDGRDTGVLLPADVRPGVDLTGVAATLYAQGGAHLPDPAAATTFTYRVTPAEGAAVDLGLAFVAFQDEIAKWSREGLYVPATFWGAGFEEDFLKRLLEVLARGPAKIAWVTLAEPALKDESSLRRYADLLQMYRTEGFELVGRWERASVLQRIL